MMAILMMRMMMMVHMKQAKNWNSDGPILSMMMMMIVKVQMTQAGNWNSDGLILSTASGACHTVTYELFRASR